MPTNLCLSVDARRGTNQFDKTSLTFFSCVCETHVDFEKEYGLNENILRMKIDIERGKAVKQKLPEGTRGCSRTGSAAWLRLQLLSAMKHCPWEKTHEEKKLITYSNYFLHRLLP